MKYDDYINEDEYVQDDIMDEQLEPCGECDELGEGAPHMKKRRTIEVEEVLGIGSAETIAEVCIPLCPPAFEILDQLVTKDIVFDVLVASNGKVFVNGRVVKDIPYKTKVRTCQPDCKKITRATFGDIRHVTVEVPFALCIDVPEAKKGNKVVVLDSEVNSVEIPNPKACLPGACFARCQGSGIKQDKCFRKPILSITEKDCIFVKVKVVKDVMITVPGIEPRL